MNTQLQKWIQSGNIPHSLLFSGSTLAENEAIQFAKQLVGCDPQEDKHPDLYFYKPEGKLGMHAIEMMRHLKDEAYLPPYKSKRKVFIIFSADRMQAPSANSLLKTFEEPPLTSTIILVSSNPEKLLPTVRSRCQTVHFQTQEEENAYLPIVDPLLSSLYSMNAITLMDEVAKLADQIEETCKQEELEAQKEETAYQKQLREKEGEGKESLQLLNETEALFISILTWYRDRIVESLTSEKIPFDLDKIAKEINKARLSLSRSGPLKNTLESLFLALRTL